MQRQYRLRKRNHFTQVYRRGKAASNRQLVLYHMPGRGLQIGISVSKKLGNAVARNKIKRRLRELVRAALPNLKRGRYVLIAREAAAGATFRELRSSLAHVIKRGSYAKEAAREEDRTGHPTLL